MTNREAIEYIERECHTCKGFYAPENECIAVPQDCFESKRLAISAIQEREERERGIEMTYKDVIDELKIAYDENGTPYMLEAFGSEAEHINRLLSAEQDNRVIELPRNTTFKEFLKKVLDDYFNITDTYTYNLTRVKEALEVGTVSIEDFEEFSEETTRDMAEYINNAIETER